MDRRALIAALAVIATACTVTGPSAPLAMISKVDVARGASEQLGVQLQEAPAVIDCANDLPHQVGAGQDCSETDLIRGQRHAVQVRIDRVDGATITYGVVVGAAPLPPPAD